MVDLVVHIGLTEEQNKLLTRVAREIGLAKESAARIVMLDGLASRLEMLLRVAGGEER